MHYIYFKEFIVFILYLDQDGAEPNPNSVAVTNLLRLSYLFDDLSLRDKAVKIFSFFSHRMTMIPLALPEMLCGLMQYYKGVKLVSPYFQ